MIMYDFVVLVSRETYNTMMEIISMPKEEFSWLPKFDLGEEYATTLDGENYWVIAFDTNYETDIRKEIVTFLKKIDHYWNQKIGKLP